MAIVTVAGLLNIIHIIVLIDVSARLKCHLYGQMSKQPVYKAVFQQLLALHPGVSVPLLPKVAV
jgi:hypothetical protein